MLRGTKMDVLHLLNEVKSRLLLMCGSATQQVAGRTQLPPEHRAGWRRPYRLAGRPTGKGTASLLESSGELKGPSLGASQLFTYCSTMPSESEYRGLLRVLQITTLRNTFCGIRFTKLRTWLLCSSFGTPKQEKKVATVLSATYMPPRLWWRKPLATWWSSLW
jgi:hypothetical protein